MAFGSCFLDLQGHFLEEADAVVDVLVHDLVDVDEVDALAVVGDHLFDLGAAVEAFLMTEVEGLSGVEEFMASTRSVFSHTL